MCALVLAEEGNLVRAAERLHTSHSNVGRKVKALQKDWGVQLFQRTLTGFDLTDEGRAAIREIRKALEHTQRGFDRALYAATRNRRPFRIGYSLYVHEKILPFLQRQGAPGTDFSSLTLRADTTMQLIPRVLRGELHVGFGVMPIFDRDLWIAPVAHEYFSACIPDTHPLRSRNRLSARELADETLYWMPRSVHPTFYDQVTDYLHGVGHHTDNLQEARAIIQGIDLAAHSLGVALVPQSAARFQRPGVLFKPLTDKLIQIETAIFARRDKMHGDILDFVNSAMAELQPAKTHLQ